MLGFDPSDNYPTAELAQAAINMTVGTRGGTVRKVIFHTDRGRRHTATPSSRPAPGWGSSSPLGRAGSALDNPAAESFFSTLQTERLADPPYVTRIQTRQDIANWIHTCCNHHRLHSTLDMTSPINYDNTHQPTLHDQGGSPALVENYFWNH